MLTRSYLACGLCPLSASLKEKKPTLFKWKIYQKTLPNIQQVEAFFEKEPEALCLLTGSVSGNLELLDFDCQAEFFDPWKELIIAENPGLFGKLVLEKSQSGGIHVVYRYREPVPGNMRLAQREIETPDGSDFQYRGKTFKPRIRGGRWSILPTLIETRGEGGLFLCSPTPGYELIQGRFENLPVLNTEERDLLIGSAWKLNQYIPQEPNRPTYSNMGYHPDTGERPGDAFNSDVGAFHQLLRNHGWTFHSQSHEERWTRPGKKPSAGHSATFNGTSFYVFTSNAPPFDPGAYRPFRVYSLLEHDGDDSAAARALRAQGYGERTSASDGGVDLSGILGKKKPDLLAIPEPEQKNNPVEDPGQIPDHLFEVPGFISQVMAYTLANAPYPNRALAFCGALALLSLLTGRKVKAGRNVRTNLYILALAPSGTGKEAPRDTNVDILAKIGMLANLGDKFASGEGIQDSLVSSPATLFQNDEIDGVFRRITNDREFKNDSIPTIMKTLYSAAGRPYVVRAKAGRTERPVIQDPHLVVFGTSPPQHFFESLSTRMLTDGFFSRMIIVDVGARGTGQENDREVELPEEILEAAMWWKDYAEGNLNEVNPVARNVPFTKEAEAELRELQRLADAQYQGAHERNDEAARTAWSRTRENALKLSLLYACSESHETPEIGRNAVKWATAFAMHQTRRQLWMASQYVSENKFHWECQRVERMMREAGGNMAHHILLKNMHMSAEDFGKLITTLKQQGTIVEEIRDTSRKPGKWYRLT